MASILGIGLISFSIFYYLVVFLPHKEQAKIDLQNQAQKIERAKLELKKQAQEESERQTLEAKSEKEARQAALAEALDDAYESYKKEWEKAVKRLGRTDGTLPKDMADGIDKHYQENKDDAYRLYGVK